MICGFGQLPGKPRPVIGLPHEKRRETGGCTVADIMHICEIMCRVPEIRLGKLSKAGRKILRNAPPAFSRFCAIEMTRKHRRGA